MNLFLVKLYNLLTPLTAFAQQVGGNEPGQVGGNEPGSSGGGIQPIDIVFQNPLGNGQSGIGSISDLLASILEIIITVGIPLVVLAVIYTGFLFVSAMGDKEKIKKAREAFLWTIIGGVIILASWVIAEAISSTVNQIIVN
jgi:hypothetical protein